ncbi:MAG TPA: hypothetical protein VLZ06_11035 [Solirubrobacteraceae bacterium]|nr:hypothetical protein [Solirubrobacteraceae bacterium]
MRRLLPAVLCAVLALGLPAGARAASLSVQPVPESPIQVALSSTPMHGRTLSARRALAIARAVSKVRDARRGHPGSYGAVYTKGPERWQVSFFARGGHKELAQVIIADPTGRVLEAWSGFQVAWTMARGYRGAFGEHVNALYIWLPLCLLFVLPFVNPRRPLSLLHLDLLVLLSFSVSLAFFNHAHIYASVPLAYPPLLYLLARMLWLLRRRAAGARPPGPLRLLVPAPWLAVALVFLVGFRVGLNVTDSNVIDVGYAGVIGAHRITADRPLYGGYPADNEHGDTYGSFNYEAYVPFQQIFGWSGRWDDLPAAHAAAIFFDLLTVGLLFLLGRRMRGPTLGIAFAYAWASYPFTLFALESNANDTLVAATVLAALLAACYPSGLARFARGAFAALAALTKLAPLALAPILATDGLRGLPARRRTCSLAMFAAGFLLFGGLAMIPAVRHDSLHTIYERTLVYQGNRDSPFSVWGLYGWHGAELAVELFAAGLAVLLAVVPRRGDLVGLAAGCAAIVLAVELAMEHWFYLYIPWFFGLAIVALLGRFSPVPARAGDAASEPARSTPRAAALST